MSLKGQLTSKKIKHLKPDLLPALSKPGPLVGPLDTTLEKSDPTLKAMSIEVTKSDSTQKTCPIYLDPDSILLDFFLKIQTNPNSIRMIQNLKLSKIR
jgi:hypothetical protein